MKSSKLITVLIVTGISFCLCLFIVDLSLPIKNSGQAIIDFKQMSIRNIDLKSVCQTLLSAVLGFLLTISFVERIIENSRNRESEQKRMNQLANISKVLKYPIAHYHTAAICITNRLWGGEFASVRLDDFYVLEEIYEPTMLFDEDWKQTRIEFFSACNSELHQSVMSVVLNTDLSCNKELSNLLTEYLFESSDLNPCRVFLNWGKMKTKDESFGVDISKTLRNIKVEDIDENNSYYPYAKLMKLIKLNEDFLTQLYEIYPSLKPANKKYRATRILCERKKI